MCAADVGRATRQLRRAVTTMRRDHVLDAFVLILIAGLLTRLLPPGWIRDTGFAIGSALYFAALLSQVIRTAWRGTPDRRLTLVLLAAGVMMWSVGSATLTAAGDVGDISFPAPGEWFFLGSYIGLAAFLLTDVPRRGAPARSIWIEAAVVCGAAACLASLLAVPLSSSLDESVNVETPLLLAVLYPLIDVILVIVVLGQVMLGQRASGVRTATLAAGFALLSVADSSFLLTWSDGTYADNPALDVCYGLSFALIVGAGLFRPPEVTARRDHHHHRGRVLVAAAAVALAAMVFNPGTDALGAAVTTAAVGTLLAAGWRLVLALREAQGAAEALRLSRTDELTGLPNRRAMMHELEGVPTGAALTLMLLDLDGFKEINDSMGHAVGDRVLIQVADRLRARLGQRLSVARLGGDEFALVAHGGDPLEMTETGRVVCNLLAEPMGVDGLELTISASLGIAIREDVDMSASDLLRRADVAMYEAKGNRAGAVLYQPAHDTFTRARLLHSEQLRRGIRDAQLSMWYQPQVDAATQEVVAVEALVRWQHPTEGLLTPAAFLPEARRYGLMPALSVDVVRQVVADARRWIDEGLHFRVALNCAPTEMLDGLVLPRLYEAIADAELPQGSLLVEVTEDSFLGDPDRARERLTELHDRGVLSGIDDYGTGFSSLSYLRDLPVRELKMDRSFIAVMMTDPGSRVIVETTTKMAHALGLRLVAEGVENAPTAAALVAMDVDVLQGYHIAPPMPAASISPWVRQWSVAPGTGGVYLPRPRGTH